MDETDDQPTVLMTSTHRLPDPLFTRLSLYGASFTSNSSINRLLVEIAAATFAVAAASSFVRFASEDAEPQEAKSTVFARDSTEFLKPSR